MSRRKSRYDEIIIRIMPLYARTESEELAVPPAPLADKPVSDNIFARIVKWASTIADRDDLEDTQTYDAYVYTDLTIPGLNSSESASSDCMQQVSDLKLAGCGQITVYWDHYHKYLRTFISGEKAAYKKFWGLADSEGQQSIDARKVRDQLFQIPTAGLQTLFDGKLDTDDRLLRVWLHCSPPELADLPWELLASELRQKDKSRFSFVRGLPPAPVPKVPVKGKLRLAFIHEPRKTPAALIHSIDELKSVLDVVKMTESPRQALARAVNEGFELVHLVTDGALSLGQDGLLYLREPSPEALPSESLTPAQDRLYRLALSHTGFFRHLITEQRLLGWNNKLISKLDLETCSAEELSAILRGSRVTLLSFSTPKTDDTDPARFDGSLLPTVYSAFASLGSSALLPNVVAPLGACDDKTLEKFWTSFYSQLMVPAPSNLRPSGPSFSLEEATAAGLEAAPTALMALFLRQRLGREFTNRVVKIGGTDEDPTRASAKLQVERSLIEQLRALDANYLDIESRIADTPLVQAESERHIRLGQEIDSLAQLEEEEL